MRRVERSARYARTRVAVLAVLALAAACTGNQSSVERKAENVFRKMIDSSPDHQVYAVSICTDSTAPQARRLILDSITAADRRSALDAVRSLGETPPEEARQPLAVAFNERRGAVKREAAVVLSRMGDEQALAWLREETASNTGSLDVAAMTLLSRLDGRESIEPLLRDRMASKDPGTRNEAYAVLGEIRSRWATDLLLEGLSSEFGEQRLQAIVSLGRCGDPKVAPQVEAFINTKGLVFAAIEALGDLGSSNSVPALTRMAGHDQSLVRAYAAVALMKLGETDKGRELLAELARDEDATVRENLADQLGEVEGADSTQTLILLAGDADKAVRLAALRALLGRSSAELNELFLAAATDADYEVGTLALHALAHSGTGEAVPILEPLMDDENPYVALSAAHAILAIGSRGEG